MKLCQFGKGRLGLVEGSIVRDVTKALDLLPAWRYPLPRHDVFIANLDRVTERALALAANAPQMPLELVKLVSPVANPGKIIAAPVNYQKHLDEVKDDVQLHQNTQAHTLTIQKAGLFLKATSSLVGPGEGVALRHLDRRNDHEVELAVIMGAQNRIAGYAIALDITIRGSEDRSFRKSPDSYTVLGPWLVTADEIEEPGQLDLSIAVNGEVRQQSNTKYMILGVPELIELASSFYTLHPGDIISTGTPEGVSPIVPGDKIVATIEKIGSMEVNVRAA
ncbi:MAG TPA: fumarylacetoacetate hydrolase family protein [Bryobacteraceae bacterium]|jgi:2-keto-4-pentenoate hydratase/2-oxohepta-3-ene-1,7-dioic acid hydratase in catechol pathway|nr:fumarylacetoacetate hydrolase family protein [Bryobacteraceae bacterium]